MEEVSCLGATVDKSKELLNRFLEDCRLRNMTERSIVGYKSCIACFFRFLSESRVGVREVENQILKDFLGYLKYSKKLKYKTVKWYFSAISGLYDFMVFEGMIGRTYWSLSGGGI
ncbi:MAG: phage integrase N-terminal SAM-like domain-containing protein [Candidatus Methanomethyliaceae archaeon]